MKVLNGEKKFIINVMLINDLKFLAEQRIWVLLILQLFFFFVNKISGRKSHRLLHITLPMADS